MKIGKSRHTRKDHCPNCDKVLDAVSGVLPGNKARDPRPRPGDFSVCAYCQYLMIFGDDLKLRAPSFAELSELAHDPRVLAVKPLLKAVFHD